MRTDVLQVFATCLQAGPFLAGETDRPPEMFGIHSTYRTVHNISFERSGTPTRDGALADRVAPWLRRLKTEDVPLIRPLLMPCTPGTQAEGAVEWGMITDGDRGIEIWQPTWKARVIGRFDDAPFSVTYTARRFSRWSVLIPGSVSDAWLRLGQSLNKMEAALEPALDHSLKQAVRKCTECHQARRLEVSGFDDLLPAGLDPEAASLAASAARSFLLLAHSAWGTTITNRKDIKGAFDELWSTTMLSFESAVCASVQPLRKTA